MTDPLAGIQQAQLIARITQRVLRGVQLGEWGLTSHPVDDGSSLALDDQDFMPDLGPRLVSSTARFPAMNASENIVAAGQVFSTALTQETKAQNRVGSDTVPLGRRGISQDDMASWRHQP